MIIIICGIKEIKGFQGMNYATANTLPINIIAANDKIYKTDL